MVWSRTDRGASEPSGIRYEATIRRNAATAVVKMSECNILNVHSGKSRQTDAARQNCSNGC
ncbi:hypothetical protein HNR05_003020 [Leifsonia psychrotolerans]|uniref:Uncharacterized protein n=1 Tax=Glaciibacter psychrotolerans TaxID=670054 RepID=A0A7Z0J7U3_9MICO|nr:hypothetical protein [Leifsonia psychrotolerans]